MVLSTGLPVERQVSAHCERFSGYAGKGYLWPKIQDLAVTCLADYAETSLVNCGKIAAVSGGPALAEIASAAVHDRHRATLKSQLTRLMSILAQDCPSGTPHTCCNVTIKGSLRGSKRRVPQGEALSMRLSFTAGPKQPDSGILGDQYQLSLMLTPWGPALPSALSV